MKNANTVSRAILILVLSVGCTLWAACERAPVDVATATVSGGDFKTGKDYFSIKMGAETVRMQLAVAPSEQMYGLMGRKDLGEDQGMLFITKQPEKKAFYMRNTPTPLDIGYIGKDGVLREIYPMYPFDERTVPSRSAEIQFALEMNQGWFQQHGVKVGDKLDLTSVAAALVARGFELKEYGMGPK